MLNAERAARSNPASVDACSLIALIALLALFVWQVAPWFGEPAWPAVWSPLPPSRADTVAIEAIIGRSSAAFADAIATGDSGTDLGLYLDRAEVPLSREQASFLHTRRVTDPALAAVTHSYGRRSYEAARVIALRGMAAVPTVSRSWAPFRFPAGSTLRVRGDLAYARYWYGPALNEAFLIRTPNGWRIAGLRILQAHAP